MSWLQKIPVILNTKIFSKLFNIAAVSNLTKEEYMKYEKDLMASWDEYAIKQTLIGEGIQKGIEKGREEGKSEVVRNLLSSGEFTIAKIANLVNVSEVFVRKVKKDAK